MTRRMIKIELDRFPGYTALIQVKEDDICLVLAGKKYREYFLLSPGYEGKSILNGLSDTEKATLCTSVFNKAKKKKEFTYFRKALRRDRGISWIQVRASYLKDMEEFPVFIAVAEDVTDILMTRAHLEEAASSLERENRELNRRMSCQKVTEAESARAMVEAPKVYIRTFGYFDVFINGKVFEFTSKKGKELLAILVDRNGGMCTAEEAISILWENEPLDKAMTGRYRQIAWRLKKTLERAGIGDIVISKRTGKYVDTSRFECDLYQFLNGQEKYKKLFHHHYMTNYSWGENTLAILEAMKNE